MSKDEGADSLHLKLNCVGQFNFRSYFKVLRGSNGMQFHCGNIWGCKVHC